MGLHGRVNSYVPAARWTPSSQAASDRFCGANRRTGFFLGSRFKIRVTSRRIQPQMRVIADVELGRVCEHV